MEAAARRAWSRRAAKSSCRTPIRIRSRFSMQAPGGANRTSRCEWGRRFRPIPLSYSFLSGLFLADLPFGKGTGTRPDFSGSSTPLASARQQRLLHHPEHSLSDFSALFLTGGGGEDRQKGIYGVPSHGETKLSRGQLQRFGCFVDRRTR